MCLITTESHEGLSKILRRSSSGSPGFLFRDLLVHAAIILQFHRIL